MMKVADATIKFSNEFETPEAYDLYVEQNWQKILIHNLFVLAFQINMLVSIENQREAQKQMVGGDLNKLILKTN